MGNSSSKPKDNFPSPSEHFKAWSLRPDVVHLDHGSCGGCPRMTMDAQRRIGNQIEEGPHDWFAKNYASGLRVAKEALANFLSADIEGLALMPGTTHGLNVAAFSQTFHPGDELLITDHAYSSATMVLKHIAARVQARVVIAKVPFPVRNDDEVVDSILSYVTPKTKFAIIDHIPSRTGVIFPIKRIVAELDSREVITLVDGAHGPGQIEVNLRDINAPYYVASIHKWMCAPRGLGLLYVRKDMIARTKPVLVARTCYFRDKGTDVRTQFEHDFDWIGTFDPSTYFCLPTIIKFLSTICPGGFAGLARRNHQVALEARKIIHRELGTPPACPDDMLGSMVTFPLPDTVGPESPQGTLPLQKHLMDHAKIEIQVYNWPEYPKRVVRFSIQAHNSLEQIEYLARHLKAALEAETRSSALAPPDIKAIQAPLPRQKREDLTNPTFEDLIDLAMWRVLESAIPNPSYPPPRLFPTAEKTRDTFFTVGEWSEFGKLESEYGRLSWMLSTFPERGAPTRSVDIINGTLRESCVLSAWSQVFDELRKQSQTTLTDVVHSMTSQLPPVQLKSTKDDFITVPVDYDFDSDLTDNVLLKLLLQSSRRLATLVSQGIHVHIVEYIQIHAFIRDPIGGLKRDFSRQEGIFRDLLSKFRHETKEQDFDCDIWTFVVAQLAQESSFLADPLIDEVDYVHFARHQQLPYVYVELCELTRAEFSVPEHVMLIMQEMMDDILGSGECRIVPIMVASVPSVADSRGFQKIIIDGNTRATATMIFKLLALFGMESEAVFTGLDRYCLTHGLCAKWRLDLRNVLQTLFKTESPTLKAIQDNHKVLQRFMEVTRLPGLLTQEPIFHTICLQRMFQGRPRILQPMHQIIHNDRDCGLALPARRSQAHGRPKDYVILPLK